MNHFGWLGLIWSKLRPKIFQPWWRSHTKSLAILDIPCSSRTTHVKRLNPHQQKKSQVFERALILRGWVAESRWNIISFMTFVETSGPYPTHPKTSKGMIILCYFFGGVWTFTASSNFTHLPNQFRNPGEAQLFWRGWIAWPPFNNFMLGICPITTNPSTPNMSGLKLFKQFRWCRSQQNNPNGHDFEPSIISGVDGPSSEQSVCIVISLKTTWLLTLVGMTIWNDCAKILCSYTSFYLYNSHQWVFWSPPYINQNSQIFCLMGTSSTKSLVN